VLEGEGGRDLVPKGVGREGKGGVKRGGREVMLQVSGQRNGYHGHEQGNKEGGGFRRGKGVTGGTAPGRGRSLFRKCWGSPVTKLADGGPNTVETSYQGGIRVGVRN